MAINLNCSACKFPTVTATKVDGKKDRYLCPHCVIRNERTGETLSDTIHERAEADRRGY